MKIKITKFREFNPRKDYKTLPWVRLNTDLFFSPSTDDLSAEEIALWIFLLMMAARKNCDEFDVTESYISKHSRVQESRIRDYLSNIEKNSMISISRSSDVRETFVPRSLRNDTNVTERTNVTNERESTDVDALVPEIIHPLVDLWNLWCEKLPKVNHTNASRRKKCEARFRESPEGIKPNDYFSEIVRKIAASDFCNGKSERGWRATFDWLLQPETHLKVSEGKYDNRGSSKAQLVSNANMSMLERVKKGEL